MTTAPFEPGSDPSINPGERGPDPVAPGTEPPEEDPTEPQPTES